MSYRRILVFVLADVVALVAASSQIVQRAPSFLQVVLKHV